MGHTKKKKKMQFLINFSAKNKTYQRFILFEDFDDFCVGPSLKDCIIAEKLGLGVGGRWITQGQWRGCSGRRDLALDTS